LPGAAGRDDVCTLGRWLATHWPAPDEQSSYDKVKKLHTEFHKTAGEIARLARKGDKAGAEKLLGVGSRYAQLSSELTLEMMRWKKLTG
jgi:methyl-accepting chemotaxis protein